MILCHSYTDPFFNQFSARVGVGWEADRIVFSLGYLNGPPKRGVDNLIVMANNLSSLLHVSLSPLDSRFHTYTPFFEMKQNHSN